MADQNQSLQSLSQDLVRIAMGRYRGQSSMVVIFNKEALARIKELSPHPLFDKIIFAINSPEDRAAEDLLMYSNIIKNMQVSR